MLLKLVECLARLALPGTGPPSAEPGIGEAPAGFGELLFDQAGSAVVRSLGHGCGVGSLICFSHCLLGRRDGPAVFLLGRRDGLAVLPLSRGGQATLVLRGRDGLQVALLLRFYPGCSPCGRPWRARSRGSGARHRPGRGRGTS